MRGTFDPAAAQRKDQDTRTSGGAPVDERFTNVEGQVDKTIAHHIEAVSNGSHPILIKWLGAIYAGCEVHRDVLVRLATNDIWGFLGFVLFRPHATYKTRFGIKCADRGGTGYVFFGNSDMQIENEAARKVGLMHYTAYLSAVVLKPKNVYVVEDIFCERYKGGMGVEFWRPQEYINNTNRTLRSIICAPMPPNVRKLHDTKMDIRGRWYTEMQMRLVSKERADFPHYDSCARMNMLFRFHDKMEKDTHANQGRVAVNFVCFQGMEWYPNPITGAWDDFSIEQGHMGPNVYPGCGIIRNGGLTPLATPSYIAAGTR